MYSEAELRVLSIAEDGMTISDLAENLDRSRNYVSELVRSLDAVGLVRTEQSGQTTRVIRSSVRAIERLDALDNQFPHIPFPELIAGSTLRILYWLDEPRSSSDLATLADVHRSTVYRSLRPLMDRGLLYKDDSEYALNDPFRELSTIARECAHHRHRHRIGEHASSYAILWESLDECLVQTNTEIQEPVFHETGPALFQAFDIPLVARQRRYYLFSDSIETISAAELCCHMLVIDDGPRFRSYCLLLLADTAPDPEYLLDVAAEYDVTAVVTSLLEYLSSRGAERTDTLPPWSEFETLAGEYGVAP